jgi:hypothetical protein
MAAPAPAPILAPVVGGVPAVGAASAYFQALFAGPENPFLLPPLDMVSLWTLGTPATTRTSTTGAVTQVPAAGPTDFLYCLPLHELPDMRDQLERFTLVNVTSIRVHLPPQYVDVDVTIGLVPSGTVTATSEAGARLLFASHGQQQVYWRKSLTVAQTPYVDLVVPAKWPITTSLKAAAPGLYGLSLAIGFRPLVSPTLPAQPVHLRIEMGTAVSGLGIWGHRAIH